MSTSPVTATTPPQPTPATDPPTNIRYVVLGWACSLSMLTYIDRVCLKDVQGEMTEDLGLTKLQFGAVFTAFSIAYALFEVPTGWLGDRLGSRKVLLRIVLWWSFFTALTGFVWPFHYDLGVSFPWFDGPIPLAINSLFLLVVIRFLFGMGEAGAYPNIARGLRNWIPYERRGFAQGLVWLFARWGGSIATPLIWLCAYPFGWRGAFVIFGILGVVWGLLFWLNFRDSPREDPRVNEAEFRLIEGRSSDAAPVAKLPISWWSLLASPTLWCLSLMYFCSNAGWFFFISWDKEYYQKELHLEGFGLMVASMGPLFCGGIACVLGGLTTDRMVRVLGRRWGRTLQGVIAYTVGGSLFFAALVVRHPVLSVVLLCLASFAKDFGMGASWATCLDIGHRYSGTVSGFMNMIGNLGGAVTGMLVPYLAVRAGNAGGASGDWGMALVVSGCAFLLAAVGWAFIEPRRVIVYRPDDHARLQKEGAL